MKTFSIKELEEYFPDAYNELSNHHKNDSSLYFFVDNTDGKLYCAHNLGGKFRWWAEANAWIEIK